MKSVLRLSGFALASAAFLFAGCAKSPRPNPSQTVLGGNAGPETLRPDEINGPGTDLPVRTDDWSLDKTDHATLATETVYFGFDSAAISPAERPKVQKVADFLKANPGKRMRIEGHCDWRGTTEYNIGLGDRRAKAVKDYLATLGADVTNVEITSMGDQGAKENASESVMKLDRRADFALQK